jgi:hypothetical protein
MAISAFPWGAREADAPRRRRLHEPAPGVPHWARAKGWALMALVELTSFPNNSSLAPNYPVD